ncbi:MAG: dTDP-4-dehydrorhamnose 3,5-epimerase, partial [Alistipes sp.]|nr:dTDP-4-dehydrorhamnose 3,5-epimerase [Alistipes sp.]
VIIEPQLFGESRGYFMESYSERDFARLDAPVRFVQDNESRSRYGVVRGLHYQREPYSQSKLVRCLEGRVLDVAVDIRPESPTYGKYVAVELSADNHRQLFIPKGFAHGFAVLSKEALFAYKCDEFYHPEAECGIAWDDPTLSIDWGLPKEDIILSEKDKGYNNL